MAAVTNYCKLVGLEHQKCIFSQFWRPEIKVSAGPPQSSEDSRGGSFLPLFSHGLSLGPPLPVFSFYEDSCPWN